MDFQNYYFVAAAVAISLFPGGFTVPLTENHFGATLDKRVELFSSSLKSELPNEAFYRHPFECQIEGLSKDEIDQVLAGSSHAMVVTVIDGIDNSTYTVDESKGEQVYNLELRAVSNTLIVKGEALLNNSEKEMSKISLFNKTICDVVLRDPLSSEENGNDTADSNSNANAVIRTPLGDKPARPEILSSYDHIVLMNGAPEQVISCTGRGNPRPQIRWFTTINYIKENPGTVRVLLPKDPGSESGTESTGFLLFSQTNRNMSGNYTCIAENVWGSTEKTFEVDVIPIEAIDPHCNNVITNDNELSTRKVDENIHELLRRTKRHLWYQWRGTKIFIPPFNRPLDPPSKSTEGNLQKMVNYMAERLLLADKVAVSKWDSGSPVEDLPRERLILENMVRQAEERGLSPTWAEQYFRDQIEANKEIQYELINQWRIAGRRPPGPPVDLGNEVRPKIDRINDRLMHFGKVTEDERRIYGCRANVERHTRYATFLYNLDPLHQRALQIASQNLCLTPTFPPPVASEQRTIAVQPHDESPSAPSYTLNF